MDLDLQHAMDVARQAVLTGGRTALSIRDEGLSVDRKGDDSPVTRADREAETAIRDLLAATFPTHGILGEEHGEASGADGYLWVVDPVDGTRGFTRGGEHWGPLVALTRGDETLVGAAGLPVRGRYYVAGRGQGCWRDETRLRVSAVDRWERVTLSLGELPYVLAEGRTAGPLELLRTAESARCYGDVAGALQLLEGEADAWLEAGVQRWDVAPFPALVEEAGGRVTMRPGDKPGTVDVLATNGLVHDHALSVLGW